MTRWMIAWLSAALLAGTACSSPPPPPPEAMAPPTSAYVIEPGDVIGVRVWKNPELSIDVPVRNDGKITVPLLNDLAAAGHTPEELKETITVELNEYISNPDVSVVVLQTNSQRAFVIGEVPRAGMIPLSANMRVIDAISVAGGFGPWADKSDIRIIRWVDGHEETYGFDYKAYVKGKAPGTNILLRSGDTIVVPD